MSTRFLPFAVLAATLASAGVFADAEPGTEDLDAQLQAARQRLEQAAHEVADLSRQLGQPLKEHMMMMGEGPRHAMIGVQLDPESSHDGARVHEVSPGGPADEAGMRAGDLIVSVNGTDVKGADPAAEVVKLLRALEPNAKVKIRVLRDGKPQSFEITARPMPPSGPFFLQGMNGHFPEFDMGFMGLAHPPFGGLQLVTITPQLGRYFGTDKGVLVVGTPPGGILGLEDGDVILSIGGREPKSGAHATRILHSYQSGEKIPLRVLRQRKTLDLNVTMPDMPEHAHGHGPGVPRPEGMP
jgi:S1-C subfamily serine protease